MEYLKFLLPENPIALIVIIVLAVVFVFWLVHLSKSMTHLEQVRKDLTNCYDVTILAGAIHSSAPAKGDNSTNTYDYLKTRTKESMDLFANERGLKPSSPIYAHIMALFEAGMFESRLDTSELIKTTTGGIFKINTMLRTILSSFIVLGLLGTLFGLADSLNYLPQSLKVSSMSNSEQIGASQSTMILKQAIDDLFGHLGNAFAPSIWGTLLTVLGLFFYSSYMHNVCYPVNNLLNFMTNTVWIPQLIPTTSQRALESLRLSQITMNQTLEATKTVADFAKNIETEVSDFGGTLKKANRTLKTLSDYGDQMHQVVTTFGSSIGHVAGLQQEVQTLTKHFFSTVEAHQRNLDMSREQLAELQKLAKETFMQQSAQINQLLTVIHDYENNYAGEREATNESIKAMLMQSHTAIEQLEKRNQEIIEALGKPLTNNLISGLKLIEESSANQLALIVKRLGDYDTPLRATVTLMSETLETVVRRTDSLLDGIKRETAKANETSAEHIKQVGELSVQIKVLLEQLSKDIKKDESMKDGSLEKAIVELNESVRFLASRTSQPQTAGMPQEVKVRNNPSWVKTSFIAASIVVAIGVIGGLGYWQYKMVGTMAELSNSNKKIVAEMEKLSKPATAPANAQPPVGEQIPGVNQTAPEVKQN